MPSNQLSNNTDNFKLRTKPKKIVVEERDEFNEIKRQIVEKAKKRKVTALKKAILNKRERLQKRKETDFAPGLKKIGSKKSIQAEFGEVDHDQLSSGYVTIDENHEEN